MGPPRRLTRQAADPLLSTIARVTEAAGDDAASCIAAVVAAVAATRGTDVDLRLDGRPIAGDPVVAAVDIPSVVARDHGHLLPGLVREALTSIDRRRGGGVHHTRPDVAAVLVDAAFAAAPEPGIVADPSVGGGAFLLAAAERMTGPPSSIVERMVGCDIDPLAVAVTESSLALWSGGRRPRPDAIRVADFLEPDPFGDVRPDLVVGNPPFLGQLRRSTGRDDARRARLRDRWPDIGAYLDDSAAFLLAAAELVAPGGVVALIEPVSFLSARDGEAVRARLAAMAPPVAIWVADERVFGAAVDTCGIVCRSGAPRGTVRRVVGVGGTEQAPALLPLSGSWAPLIADLSGTPTVEVQGQALSSLATVTAGFRDQFYGLREAVVNDHSAPHPLMTSGLIDPLRSWWGQRRCRYDGRNWDAPSVELDRVDPSIRSWVRARMRPKLVVASQTRVIEAVADPEGRLVPCTPVVVVEPHDPADLWHLAAVLTSPVASAQIAAAMAGSALSRGALRISARRLGAVTLPPRGRNWDRAASLAHAASEGDGPVREVGGAMMTAFDLDDPSLLEWWRERLPVESG